MDDQPTNNPASLADRALAELTELAQQIDGPDLNNQMAWHALSDLIDRLGLPRS